MVVEGLIRVAIFIAYLALISLLPDLRRVFQYHAAEHKAINALEAGDELEPESVQRYSLIHPRCGTAFLLWVMVIAIFVFAFFGQPAWYWLIASRILLLPVIAGIAYELIRFAGKHSDNRVLMTLLAPGLWLQRLTTREPTLDQVEVSIRALKEVLRLEGRPHAGGAPGRSHGVACRAADRRASVVWEGSSAKGSGRITAATRRVRGPAVLRATRVSLPARADEPGGAGRGGSCRLLRDVARRRADAAARPAAGGSACARRRRSTRSRGGAHLIVAALSTSSPTAPASTRRRCSEAARAPTTVRTVVADPRERGRDRSTRDWWGSDGG